MILKLKEKYLTPWKNKVFVQKPDMELNDMIEEYDEFDQVQKKKRPIRYFLFETVPSEIKLAWINYALVPYWNFAHRFFREHQYHIVRTELDPTDYHDPDSIMLYAWMKLIKDYVETEQYTEINEEIQKVYDWWIDYPNRQAQIDDFYEIFNNQVQAGEAGSLQEAVNLEDALLAEEDEMLAILLKNRKHIWYM